MRPYLIFTLTAALGSMGELAGHERRGTLLWPGRSAILGLLGAACGIRRGGDFSRLDRLSLAVAIFDEGQALRDYHTYQTIPSAAVKAPNSRPEALIAAGLRSNTAITLRDYRCTPLYGIALWSDDDAPLEPLRDALRRPAFTLYLGRKACPLAAPPGAQVIEAHTPQDALQHLNLPAWRKYARAHRLVRDAATGEVVHDLPLDRLKWHFAPRSVAIDRVDIAPSEGAS
ncbi:type I-E CRISPR-associated protein Cas5/CasD [Sedimentitalea sp. HM32M-2]|uniref:type I-E CRISPR-associated protein Cas5/CasD n=1 Tax=Sedimentitalea sp. HM32M-2 TaxID=3351566 RepID=UPI00363F6E76